VWSIESHPTFQRNVASATPIDFQQNALHIPEDRTLQQKNVIILCISYSAIEYSDLL
jgi:hypothetical protein